MAKERPTRDRILEAARTLIWDRGYGATSPRAVMTAGDAGQGSLYHYFPTKSALGAAAIQASADDAITLARADFAVEGTAPLDRVRRYLSRERDALRGCPMGRLTGDAEVRVDPSLLHPVTGYFDELLGLVSGALADAVDDGTLPAGADTQALAAAIVAAVQGAYVLAQTGGDSARYDAAIRGAAALLDAAARAS